MLPGWPDCPGTARCMQSRSVTGRSGECTGGLGTVVPDHDVVTSHGFTPLTRRWTFADGPGDKLNKSSSCGELSVLKKEPSMVVPLSPVTNAEVDHRRELHKASLAQEMCQSVAKLMVNAWVQGNEVKVLGWTGYEKVVGEAAEAARLHFSKFPFRYAVAVDARDVLVHMKLLEQATRTGRIAVHAEIQSLASGLTKRDPRWIVTISSRDQPHLLDTITRTLTKHVTRIVDADVMTSLDGQQTLDRFIVESGERLNGPGLGRAMDFLLRAARSSGERTFLVGTPTGRDDSTSTTTTTGSSLGKTTSFLYRDDVALGGAPLPPDANSSGDLVIEDPLQQQSSGPATGRGSSISPPNLSRCPSPLLCGDVWVEDEERREAAAALLLGVSPSAAGFAKLKLHMERRMADLQQQQQQQHQQSHDHFHHHRRQQQHQKQQQQQELPQPLGTVPFEEITLGACVARGRTADIYEAVLGGKTAGEGKVVACKVVSLIQQGGGRMAPVDEQAGLMEIQRELVIVRQLSHPNICEFLGVSAGPSCFYLLYEFLEGGSLADLIRNRSRRYDFFTIASEIASGLGYLHSQGIIHRDVKSKNILLDRDGRIKIVDFGLCCLARRGEDLTGETGTYRWMAPEVIRHEPYSSAADVYSYGVVLWELLARDQPFRGMTPIQAAFSVARQGRRPPIPPQVPTQLATLIGQCWHEDPAVRPTFEQVSASLAQIKTRLGA